VILRLPLPQGCNCTVFRRNRLPDTRAPGLGHSQHSSGCRSNRPRL